MEEDLEKVIEESYDIHELWHKFCDYLQKYYYNMVKRTTYKKGKFGQTKRKYKHLDISKVTGYDAMCRVGRFAEDNPNIRIVGCDDSHHCGSDIVLIPHEDNKKYWGTTVLFIPQCTNEKNIFFLYPEHLDNLIEELKKIQRRERKKPFYKKEE